MDFFRRALLKNTRKLWPPKRGGMGGFLDCWAPRPAALALLKNTRKLWPPNRGWTGGFLDRWAPRPAALCLSPGGGGPRFLALAPFGSLRF